MAPLRSARITSEIADAFSRERMPEVASLLSSATTSSQFVPGTAEAMKVLSTSFRVPSTGLPRFSAAKSIPLIVSANGFRVKAGSLAAITVPSLFRSSPLLAGVGWMPRTFATTLSMATSPATTAFRTPFSFTGTANVTTSFPVPAST